MQTAPKRACVLNLKIEADTVSDMVDTLHSFMISMDRGGLSGSGVSGGYSSGWVYDMTASGTPTHDEYVAALQTYLAAKKAGTTGEGGT